MTIEAFLGILATAISALGVIVAVFTLIAQTRQNNATLRVNLLRDLEKEFFFEMREQRLAASKFLLNRKDNELPIGVVADILDFFDGVGIYLDKDALDDEMVFNSFYYWFRHYWELLRNDINFYEESAGGFTYYKYIRRLHKRLIRSANQFEGRKKVKDTPSIEKLKIFLKEEIKQCTLENTYDKIPQSKPILLLQIGQKIFTVNVHESKKL